MDQGPAVVVVGCGKPACLLTAVGVQEPVVVAVCRGIQSGRNGSTITRRRCRGIAGFSERFVAVAGLLYAGS